ncbi:MAG: hypothetical protein FJW66_06280 [Actinobacteria bacterium]|nr:hypothetical protein [Actinomycetota bacterium]
MSELTKEELEAGKKVVGGPTIYFWVISILSGIGLFSLNMWQWADKINFGPVEVGLPSPNTSWLFLGLYVAALVGLYIRKGWAIPVGRAALVVSMVVLFPVGTIFGAILWKRFNDPVAKGYLNYGCNTVPEEETKPEQKT